MFGDLTVRDSQCGLSPPFGHRHAGLIIDAERPSDLDPRADSAYPSVSMPRGEQWIPIDRLLYGFLACLCSRAGVDDAIRSVELEHGRSITTDERIHPVPGDAGHELVSVQAGY